MSKRTERAKLFRRAAVGLICVLAVGLITWFVLYTRSHPMAVLSPVGPVGHKERNLMLAAIILSGIVVVPVFILTIYIAVKFREDNPRRGRYQPEFYSNRKLEAVWWGIPFTIIAILSVITWQSSHALDPAKPLVSSVKPLQVQVIAMNWKWLFIYPDQQVASVNQLALPVDTPVDFSITSDSVMNSFWIPNLGSQIYAMPGMNTSLHLQADRVGSYTGSSANISGSGFADMHFMVQAMTFGDFTQWVSHVEASSSPRLSAEAYAALAQPSKPKAVSYYRAPQAGLYNDVMMKYMMPGVTVGATH
jgi:cytochrome o ubiquinol oxidase subunit 2